MTMTERQAHLSVARPDTIFEVMMGFMASKHLFIANEIGLFTALAKGPATLERVAEEIRVPARTLRIVADAMVALGFLEREDGAYRNGATADAFLSGNGPMNLSPALRFMNAIAYPLWEGFERAARSDAPARGELTAEQQKIFSAGIEALTEGPARSLANSYDFSHHRRLLDVGGGTGSFLVAILSAHQTLEGTLFELPQVADIAKRNLAASPVAARVSVIAGNAMENDLPEGHDVVLLANIVHYFLPKQNVELVERVRASVEPGARLLLVDFWTDPTHTQPVPAALMAGEFLANVGGDVYSAEEMRAWLARTGWREVEKLPLAGAQSAIVAEAV
ncbi:MAG: methyltransferase [Solirubrobacterales bacterium]|nr:methyltransferase [Solirubrobacterales bacterium]MBV9422120.1 methyltransferase [Solirubrobacterales bacterium]